MEQTEHKTKALVVLSGGQDSTTCLAWAKNHFDEVHAVSFDYGQKHKIELESAQRVAKIIGVDSYELITLPKGILQGFSPLVSDEELEQYENAESLPGGVEKTFVPCRNQMFITIAANRAFVLGCDNMVTGVCQADYGGYPDCRQDFITSLQRTLNLGTFTGEDWLLGNLIIHTPLMNLTKAQSIQLAIDNGAMQALAFSHTAYDGIYPPVGKDHASLLRAKGFEEFGIPDPLVLRAWKEGLMELPDTPNYSSTEVNIALDHLEQGIAGDTWYDWGHVQGELLKGAKNA